MMFLPSEIIELVVNNLRNEDQYNCLVVNKSWYEATHRALYKIIRINTRYKLKLLFSNLKKFKQNRLLIRQLYLRKNQSVVGITTTELDDLATWCPFLEVIDFDSKIWKYIQYPKQLLQRQLIKLPSFDMNTPLLSFFATQSLYKITELNLQGELVSKLFENQASMLVQLLQSTSILKTLRLNSHQHKSHVILVSLQDLELMHHTAPLLRDLVLSGSFQFITNPNDDFTIVPSYHLHHLKLKAIIPPSLLFYIAQKYPNLITLDFEFLIHYYYKQIGSTSPINPFCHLLDSCPRLCRIEIDSHAAKEFMTVDFLKKARYQLKEIKMKNLPYHLITRDQPFFDILMQYGQRLITGLGTEVMDSLSSIINPLSCCSQLTELVLFCGHPYFDCALDVILDACQQLTALTIRSAHVLIEDGDGGKQHRLTSLHLSTVSFSSNVFDYLGKYCHGLNQLSFYECDSQGKIEIHMPNNDFELIALNGIRLDTIPLESHAWMPNARILCIQTEKEEEEEKRWYHVYNSHVCYPGRPKLQRLNERKTEIARHYYEYGWINSKKNLQRAISQKQRYSRPRKEWEQDLCFGLISIQCKSIKYWELICDTTFNEF